MVTASLGFWMSFPWYSLKQWWGESKRQGELRSFADRFERKIVPAFLREVDAAAKEDWDSLSDTALLFAAGFLFASGQALVDLLYDPRYTGAGEALRILSFTMVASRYAVFNQVYMALGIPKYQAVANAFGLGFLIVMLPLGYHFFGLPGAIAAIALKGIAPVPVMFYINAKHGLNNFRLEAALLAVWPVGYAAGLVAAWLLHQLPSLR